MLGYKVISELLTDILGIKSDIFLLISLSIYIARIIINIASESIWTLFSWHLMSTIVIESYHNLYFLVIDWVTNQYVIKNARSLQAKASRILP